MPSNRCIGKDVTLRAILLEACHYCVGVLCLLAVLAFSAAIALIELIAYRGF
jgi:hypothetical protein